MNENIKKKEIYCGNCGRKGHMYKNCHYPIISIGIICIKLNNININFLLNRTKKMIEGKLSLSDYNKIKNLLENINEDYLDNNLKYLIIRRKNSLSMVEFLRGKYNIEDIDYLYNTFSLMTHSERNMVKTDSFDSMWLYLWNLKNSSHGYINEYELSKKKYDTLKQGIKLKIGNLPIKISLNDILNNTKTKWVEPEWGFPKGRRNFREKDVNCAMREFTEETNYKYSDYQLINIDKLTETYMGTNNVRYKHTYYVGQITTDKNPIIDTNNKNQISEIGDIEWNNYNNCIQKIRDYNLEKRNILRNLHNTLKIILLETQKLFNDLEINNYKNDNTQQKVI